MFKFIFTRTIAPTTPSWDTDTSPPDWAAAGVPRGLEGATRSLWRWLGGDTLAGESFTGEAGAVDGLGVQLTAEHSHGDELRRHAATYKLAELAASGGDHAPQAVEQLLAAITHPTCEGARRVAIPGLAAAGDAVVPSLIAVLEGVSIEGDKPAGQTLAYCADALGEAAS